MKNVHDFKQGRERILKAQSFILKFTQSLLNKSYKPYDETSFSKYFINFTKLTRTNMKPEVFILKNLLTKSKQMSKRMLSNFNKTTTINEIKNLLDIIEKAFDVNDYKKFEKFESNYVSDLSKRLAFSLLRIENEELESSETFVFGDSLFPDSQ